MIKLPINYLGCQLDPTWKTYVNVLQPNDELPLPDRVEKFYGDFETTEQNPTKKSINPHSESFDETSANLHKSCKILGFSFLFDTEPIPYYVPVRHYYLDDDDNMLFRSAGIQNVDPERVNEWLKKLLCEGRVQTWFNHNIKYDVHVFKNQVGVYPRCNLVDSMTRSKLGPFQERFSYGLTEMMQVLEVDITPYEESLKTYLGRKYKDYGLVPPDKMAVYAAVDVLAVRYLMNFLDKNGSHELGFITGVEDKLLKSLIQMEQVGVRVDLSKCFKDWNDITPRQMKRIQYIKAKSGYSAFDPHKEASIEKLFVDTLGLHLDYTGKSLEKFQKGLISEEELNRSFGYASLMKHYKKYPKIINAWMKYQENDKLLNSFTIPYIEEHSTSDSRIHCNFNQIVRTGRMSCTKPNMMQLSERAKEYIVPYTDDYILVDFDLSQIEFRVIVHYIENKKAIHAFKTDPKMDYHVWVADMCKIKRKPAKTVNFLIGFGGGEGRLVAELSQLPDIIGELTEFSEIRERARSVYYAYHNNLPELKPKAKHMEEVCRARGYVRTIMQRRRYLIWKRMHTSFNSVCQGSAADIQKYLTAYRISKLISVDCLLHGCVHDSWLFSIKKDRAHEIIPEIKYQIEKPIEEINFSVPIVCDFGTSTKNWRDCDNNKGRIAI